MATLRPLLNPFARVLKIIGCFNKRHESGFCVLGWFEPFDVAKYSCTSKS